MKLNFLNYPYCQHVLPLVYDDSLSYYEVLCKITSKINEIIEAYATSEDKMKEIVTAAIAEFKLYVDEENLKQDENARKKYDEINEDILKLSIKINENFAQTLKIIEEKNLVLKIWVANEINALKDWIEDFAIGKIYIFNPLKGETTLIQTAVNDIYQHMRYGALTAYEYDRLNLSAGNYTKYAINAITFDCNAKNIFRTAAIGVFNTYGLFQTLACSLSCILDRTKNDSLNAGEYDALELSAESYAEKNMDAYEYDFLSKSILQGG